MMYALLSLSAVMTMMLARAPSIGKELTQTAIADPTNSKLSHFIIVIIITTILLLSQYIKE